MKIQLFAITALACVLSCGTATASELLYSDNFDAPDTGNLDLSVQTGRRAGLNTLIQVRSSRIQHGIAGNRLNFLTASTGRIRFHDDLDNNNATAEGWHDWATGAVGAKILADGGLRVEFDWIAGNNTSANWVSFNVGLSNQAAGEPGFRVNHAATDIGLLFRFNGQTELFDNGTNLGAQGTFPAIIGSRHVRIDYLFNSFADGAPVTMVASVDGVEVFNGGSFTWDGNAGTSYMELGTLESTLIDNLSLSTVAPDGLVASLDASTFASTIAQGGLIGMLSATNGGSPEASTFALVAGVGATDNGKFQLSGTRLEAGAFDFSGAPDATEYSIRVRATGNVSAATVDTVFLLTLRADSDMDGLPDAWELAFAVNLTVLDGRNGHDADRDGISDLDEYLANPTANPAGLNPTNPDSDGDDLGDGAELLAGTDPTNPDTDDDELLDGFEIEIGSNPLNKDTDGDRWRDGLERTLGSDLKNSASVPQFAPGVSLGRPIKDDCSSGISNLVTYTHLVSGGDAATINGIEFGALSDVAEPAGLIWTASGGKNVVLNNNGEWNPANGGVKGPGMISLLESFSYSGGGAGPGSTQSYALAGLTPGETYDLRVYIRLWSMLTTRFIDMSLVNGGEILGATPEGGAPEDRPSLVLMNGGNENQAYFVNFRYTAQGTSVVLNANVPTNAAAGSGSFHLYGLTNELVPGAAFDFRITAITRDVTNPNAPVSLTFSSRPGARYAVDFSFSMTPTGQPGGWQNIDDNVMSGGESTTFVDSFIATNGFPAVSYRVRQL